MADLQPSLLGVSLSLPPPSKTWLAFQQSVGQHGQTTRQLLAQKHKNPKQIP